MDSALTCIKTNVRGALCVERQQRAIFQPLMTDSAFGGAVIRAQTFTGIRLPELPAAAHAEQQQ
ncbi:hypothetical protein SDC9_157643 [bioreactor metagenome]|uniref:Uncharacterized protein n=1 Tax=bioreactor metagenome TaxID=1076179 RepID=A0A645F7J8_9ZZZZ